MQRYTMTEIVNHSRSTLAEHLTGIVKYYWGGGGGGVKGLKSIVRGTAKKNCSEETVRTISKTSTGGGGGEGRFKRFYWT